MQFLYDKQVVVKRYSSTLGEFNRPNKTLVEVGTYECHTAESSTTTAQLQPQKKNTTDLTLYTDPEAPIKRGDILYIYELDEYDKPIMSTEFKAIADKPYPFSTITMCTFAITNRTNIGYHIDFMTIKGHRW